MARPFHVKTIDEYLDWVDRTIEWFGGYLPQGHLRIEQYPDEEGRVVVVQFSRQVIAFYDGLMLEFDLTIDNELRVLESHFAYRRAGGIPLCRLDMHEQPHVAELTHIHWPDGRGGEVVESADFYDFDDAIQFFREKVTTD